VHSFVFGTRLTNISRQLRHRDVDIALGAISESVKDWSGGTRIGATLKEFNQRWSRRVLGQNAVVMLISDGLDRDAGEDLTEQIERLHKSCHQLIWLNPLLRFEDFEPRAAGVRLMLPHVMPSSLRTTSTASPIWRAHCSTTVQSRDAPCKVSCILLLGLFWRIGNMEMSGEQRIPLSQQRVWRRSTIRQFLKACIAGCESIERVSENEYKVAMTAAVGPVKAKFNGKLLLADMNPPHPIRWLSKGRAGPQASAKAGRRSLSRRMAMVRCSRTRRRPVSAASWRKSVPGLIDGVARKMADDFFDRFNKTVAPAADTAAAQLESPVRAGSSRDSSRLAMGPGRHPRSLDPFLPIQVIGRLVR
jgi:carbon monoxide dehydrogenase subunit G